MMMLKLALVLACSQLAYGMRVNTKKELNQSNASFDILMCDKMCMQCPSGRNILIQRQKSTGRAAFSLGAGVVSFGWGTAIVNQLAGCNKIGFEFWQNKELAHEQPLTTDAWFGMFPHAGLEKLREHTDAKTTEQDLDAIEHCEKLTDAYLWQAVRGAFSLQSGHSKQQEFARKCLSHTELCGNDLDWDVEQEDLSELKVARLNPFAHSSMCSAPKEGTEDDDSDLTEYEKLLRGADHFEKVGQDNVNFKDHRGFPCSGWEGYECSQASARYGYTQAGEDAILSNCPATCGAGEVGEEVDQPSEGVTTSEGNSDGTAGSGGDGSGTSGTSGTTAAEVVNDATHSAMTVEAAGILLDEAEANAGPGSSSDPTSTTAYKALVKETAHGYCRSESHKDRCLQNSVDAKNCKDRCCMDVCTFFSKTTPSCVAGCLKN